MEIKSQHNFEILGMNNFEDEVNYGQLNIYILLVRTYQILIYIITNNIYRMAHKIIKITMFMDLSNNVTMQIILKNLKRSISFTNLILHMLCFIMITFI